MRLLPARVLPKAQLVGCLRWVDLGGLGLVGLSILLYVGAGWSWRAPWGFSLLLLGLGLNSAGLVLLRRPAQSARPWRMDRLLGQSIVFVLGMPWLLRSVANPGPGPGTIYQTDTLTVTASPHFSFSFRLNMNESYVGNDVTLFTRRLWLFEQKIGTFYQPPAAPAYAGTLPDLTTGAGWYNVHAVVDDTGRGLRLTDSNGHEHYLSFE